MRADVQIYAPRSAPPGYVGLPSVSVLSSTDAGRLLLPSNIEYPDPENDDEECPQS